MSAKDSQGSAPSDPARSAAAFESAASPTRAGRSGEAAHPRPLGGKPLESLAHRTFTHADQERFAVLSGDANALHVDPVAARRMLYGRQVVHGVHAVLWALDRWCSTMPTVSPRRLVATFNKPVFLDERVDVVVAESGEASVMLRIVLGEVKLMSLRVDLAPGAEVAGALPGWPGADESGPQTHATAMERDLTIDEIDGLAGQMPVVGDAAGWEAALPDACRVLGPATVAQIAGLSALVGMECPGRHSLFGGFDVRVMPGGSSAGFDWSVALADTRFALVQLAVGGGLIDGSVSAFVRPRPTPQPTMAALAAAVEPREFEGLRALVVGGSRGLGEVTAKLLAAGGADVIVTWQSGEADAVRVAGEIQDAGGSAVASRLDVGQPMVSERVSHMFYFATPRITGRRLTDFDRTQFDTFIDIYVDAFVSLATSVAAANDGELTVFYPSTVYIDEGGPEVIEYAAAKAAGEVAARLWAASGKRTRAVIERLPRLATDQTAALRPVEFADAMPVLLSAIRRTTRNDGAPSP